MIPDYNLYPAIAASYPFSNDDNLQREGWWKPCLSLFWFQDLLRSKLPGDNIVIANIFYGILIVRLWLVLYLAQLGWQLDASNDECPLPSYTFLSRDDTSIRSSRHRQGNWIWFWGTRWWIESLDGENPASESNAEILPFRVPRWERGCRFSIAPCSTLYCILEQVYTRSIGHSSGVLLFQKFSFR